MVTIDVRDLVKNYDVAGGVEVAVNGIDLSVEEGEFVTLLGPSGCGKTTILRCIAGLEQPTSGTIQFDGNDVTNVPSRERNLSMMFQNIALYPHMTLRENIAYPLKVNRVPVSERHERAEDAASVMQIVDIVDKYPGEVSGGQRQRAALARTVIQEPDAFLMDEPLSDLDAKLKLEIQEEIQRLHKRLGKPTIYVTHDQQEALRMSDRIIILSDGRISQSGSPHEIIDRPANLFVARFIGNPGMNLVTGTLDSFSSDGARFSFGSGSISFDVEEIMGDPAGEGAVLGFHPPNVTLTDPSEDNDFFGTVELLEPIDEQQTLVTVRVNDDRFKLTIPRSQSLSEEEQIGVSIDSDRIYVFDANTQQLLTVGTKQSPGSKPTETI